MHDLAADRPDVVARLEEAMKGARTDSPLWPTDLGGGKGKAATKKPAGKAATKG